MKRILLIILCIMLFLLPIIAFAVVTPADSDTVTMTNENVNTALFSLLLTIFQTYHVQIITFLVMLFGGWFGITKAKQRSMVNLLTRIYDICMVTDTNFAHNGKQLDTTTRYDRKIMSINKINDNPVLAKKIVNTFGSVADGIETAFKFVKMGLTLRDSLKR